MQTAYIGITAGARLGTATRYRLTLVADSGWYDGARFDSKARSLWDGLASSGMVFPTTPVAVTADDRATTFDVKTSSTVGIRTAADLVRWIEEQTGGTVHVGRLERLIDLSGQSVNDEASRTRATASAEEQRAAAQPTALAGQFLSGVRTTTIAIAIGLVAAALIYFGRRPR